MDAITASCAFRRPKIITSRSDIVFYRAVRGTRLATVCEEFFICEQCWKGWLDKIGVEIPGQWVRTEIRRPPGLMCDASTPLLRNAWTHVLLTKTTQALEDELDRRTKTMDKCAARGGSYDYMYEVTMPPHYLPPMVPPSYRPEISILICPKCFDLVDATPIAQHFQKVPASTNVKCVCGSHIAIANSLVVAASENDIDVFVSTAWSAIYFSRNVPTRKGHGDCSDNGKWYNLSPVIKNFVLCEACAHTTLWAFPVVRQLVQPEKGLSDDEMLWIAKNGDPRLCDFSQSVGRLVPILLEMYHAQANKSPSEFHTFASRISTVRPCQGARESKMEVPMYVSDKLQALDICEDCYITQFEHSDFGALFHLANTNKRYPTRADLAEYNLTCDLASPRVKSWLKSVMSDLEYGVTDSCSPFREWLAIRRVSLQKLVLRQWFLRKQQLLQDIEMRQKHLLSSMLYSGGSSLEIAGCSNGYLYGNSNIGWYENDSLAESAKLSKQAFSMSNVQPLADAMQVEMQIQQLI